MVVHKGPVAVGLAAYLRSARWTPSRVHKGGCFCFWMERQLKVQKKKDDEVEKSKEECALLLKGDMC
jgi:hypothetical protein